MVWCKTSVSWALDSQLAQVCLINSLDTSVHMLWNCNPHAGTALLVTFSLQRGRVYMYNMQKRRTTSSIGWSHTFPLPLETVSYESAIICLIQSITINVVCIKKHHTCHFLPSAVMAWHYLVIKYCSTKNFANYSIHFFFLKAAVCWSTRYSYDSSLHILCNVICGSVHHFLGIAEIGTQEWVVHAASLPVEGVSCINREYSIALEALLLLLTQ